LIDISTRSTGQGKLGGERGIRTLDRLTQRLRPDFKTIANFRKDNGKAIRNVCRQFVVLCRQLDLFSDAVVAIDGSKFKAVKSSDRNFTDAKLKRRMQEIEANITRYLAELDTADRHHKEAMRKISSRRNPGARHDHAAASSLSLFEVTERSTLALLGPKISS
jgi:hypothetical protein